MKQFTVIFSVSVLFFVSIAMTFSSCTKDPEFNSTTNLRPCDQVHCLNGGICDDGNCHCSNGWQGERCEIAWSDKFLGDYLAYDICNNGTSPYDVIVEGKVNNAVALTFKNLGVFCNKEDILALVDPEKTAFSFPLQNTCGDFYVSGTGNIKDSVINISLQIRDSIAHQTQICSILLRRKSTP